MAITSETLKNSIVETIKAKGAEGGFLSALGATPIGYGVDALRMQTLGGSSTTLEGRTKKMTAHSDTEFQTIKAKQTIMLLATKESEFADGSRNALNTLTTDAVSRIITDVDLAITLGRSRDDGSLVPEFADQAIVPNANEVLLNTPGDTSTFPATLVSALSNSTSLESGILVSAPAYNSLAYATNAAGTRIYPEADHTQVFPVYGHSTKVSSSFGFNATDLNGKDVQPNGNLALVGDFSQVYRSVDRVLVDDNSKGVAGGVNLWETNQIAYLIEVFYSFAVINPNEFTVITSEVDAGE